MDQACKQLPLIGNDYPQKAFAPLNKCKDLYIYHVLGIVDDQAAIHVVAVGLSLLTSKYGPPTNTGACACAHHPGKAFYELYRGESNSCPAMPDVSIIYIYI